MRVAIIGCGNIGKALAIYIDKQQDLELSFLVDINSENLRSTFSCLRYDNPQKASLYEAVSMADIIFESANKDVVKDILNQDLLDQPGKTFIAMSTIGLVENEEEMKQLENCNVVIPSGAIGGLDAIRAVAGQIEFLSLTTIKPVTGLLKAPYVLNNNINLQNLKEKEKIFEGHLHDAMKGFPQNINVAASLYLASRFDGFTIKIFVDPMAKNNTHIIICKGRFGEIAMKMENAQSVNPNTSSLAILSAQAAISSLSSHVKILS